MPQHPAINFHLGMIIMIGIYKITNTLNNKCYIGQSVDIERRWRHHKETMNNPHIEAYNKELYKDMRSFGLDNFLFEVLEECFLEELNDKEKYWIRYYNSYEKGYNLTRGGNGLLKYDYDKIKELWDQGLTTEKISKETNISYNYVTTILGVLGITAKEKLKRNNTPNDSHSRYSKKVYQKDLLTHEIINIFDSVSSAANFLEVCRASFREALKNHNNEYRGFYWEIDSDSVKEKRDFSTRKVAQIDKNTDKILQIFPSLSQAAKNIEGQVSCISKACKNKINTYKGFKWRYIEENE